MSVLPAIQHSPSDPPSCAPAVMSALSGKFERVQKIAAARNSEKVQQWLINKIQLSDVKDIDRARSWDKILPTRQTLAAEYELLHEAVFIKATPIETRLIFGTLIDAIPHARNAATPGFIESLVFAVMHADDDHDDPWMPGNGFSLPVLHMAARRILTKHKFCPAISEIIEEARLARTQFWTALQTTDRLLELRFSAEDVIGEYEIDSSIVNECNDPNALPF